MPEPNPERRRGSGGAGSSRAPAIVEEVHFDGRAMRCYAERPRNINRMFGEAIEGNPGGDAVVDGENRFTYRQLGEWVGRIAANFAAAGIRQGDRVAIATGNRWEFIAVLLGALRLGAIAVPINCREQRPGFAHILEHSGASALVYDSNAGPRLPEQNAVPALRDRFALDDVIPGDRPGDRPFADLLSESGKPPADVSAGEEDVAVILYTSGTTGRPKGVMLTHLNLCHSVLHFEFAMELGPADRSVLAVPVSHVTGLVANILTMIRVAGCTLVLPRFTAEGFLGLAARERMTHTLIVPAMYNLCLMRADFTAWDLSAWRIGGFGGAPMPEATIAALAEKLPGLTLMNAYGATETTSPATIMPMGGTALRPDSVGKPVACGSLRIVDDGGLDVAAGSAGEIRIAGPMVTPGYWRDPEITAASFAGPYWRSGDIGSIDADGFVRLHDRKKDMIIRGGYNIYSAEVENCLIHHPAIVECAAIARPDPVLGEKLHVFVHAPQAGLSADEVRAFCAERLADYKIPDFVTFTDEPLPRNPAGKVVKAELRDRAAKG